MSIQVPSPFLVAGAWAAVWLAGLGGEVYALDPTKAITQYSHSSWQTDDGLPQNTVRAFAQTTDGYLWAGTEAGLVRFDGVRFRVFNRTSHGQVFDNHHIYALTAGEDGVLWIGTNGGGLVRLEDGAFQRFGEAEGLPAGRVTALALGGDGTLWIGTYGGGLARLRDGRIDAVFDQRAGLSHPVVFDVAVDHEGTVWVATYGGGLNRLQDDRFDVFNTSTGMASDHVWSVHPGHDGELWIGTDRGLHRWHEGRFEVFNSADGLPHDRILSVLQDRDGILWLGTYGGGLARWIDGAVSHLDRDLGQWTSNNIWTLFEDREGTLWAGTLGGGLHQLKDGPFTTYSLDEGMSSEAVSSIYEDFDGALWFATRGGLHRLQEGAIEVLTTADGLASNSLWAVYRDSRGDLWVGHSGAGVNRRKDGRWLHLGVDDGLADRTVLAFLEDRQGDLWIATNGGLNRWRGDARRGDARRNGTLETFTTADGLAGNQVRSLLEDRAGRLWIGTTRGLSRYDGQAFTNFFQADGLGGNNVDALLEDAEGTLWIATVGGGLSRLRDGEITAFTSRDGLLDDDVRSILDDGTGDLWLSTSRGVFQVAKADLEAFAAGHLDRIGGVAYGRRDGLKSENCFGGQPSSVATRDGRLWFSTLDGVAVVDPRQIEHMKAPTVLVEEVTVDSRVLPSLPKPLPPHSRTVELRYTAPTLLVPGKIRLRHRLLGFDDTWRPADDSRVASYNNLEPGGYTFEVTASDEQGRWNGDVTSYAFRIQPAFYQTLTFRLLGALALLLFALALHQIRTRRLRRRADKLSAEVAEAMDRLRILRGLLPICASCKNIRDDDGSWVDVTTYIDAHSEAAFTHGICPDCATAVRKTLGR